MASLAIAGCSGPADPTDDPSHSSSAAEAQTAFSAGDRVPDCLPGPVAADWCRVTGTAAKGEQVTIRGPVSSVAFTSGGGPFSHPMALGTGTDVEITVSTGKQAAATPLRVRRDYSASTDARSAVSGTVNSRRNPWRPLAGATVTIGGASAVTDASGGFRLENVPRTADLVHVHAPGHIGVLESLARTHQNRESLSLVLQPEGRSTVVERGARSARLTERVSLHFPEGAPDTTRVAFTDQPHVGTAFTGVLPAFDISQIELGPGGSVRYAIDEAIELDDAPATVTVVLWDPVSARAERVQATIDRRAHELVIPAERLTGSVTWIDPTGLFGALPVVGYLPEERITVQEPLIFQEYIPEAARQCGFDPQRPHLIRHEVQRAPELTIDPGLLGALSVAVGPLSISVEDWFGNYLGYDDPVTAVASLTVPGGQDLEPQQHISAKLVDVKHRWVVSRYFFLLHPTVLTSTVLISGVTEVGSSTTRMLDLEAPPSPVAITDRDGNPPTFVPARQGPADGDCTLTGRWYLNDDQHDGWSLQYAGSQDMVVSEIDIDQVSTRRWVLTAVTSCGEFSFDLTPLGPTSPGEAPTLFRQSRQNRSTNTCGPPPATDCLDADLGAETETLLNTIEGLREENYWALRSEGLLALVALGGCYAAALTWNRSPGIR